MRFATILASLALATVAAAPAGACVIYTTDSIYFEAPPADLAPNEVVLEVKFEKSEPYELPPFFMTYTAVQSPPEGRSANYRLSVVRAVRGEFSGAAVLVPISSLCGGRAPPTEPDALDRDDP